MGGRGSTLIFGKITLSSEAENMSTLMNHLDELIKRHGYPGSFPIDDLDSLSSDTGSTEKVPDEEDTLDVSEKEELEQEEEAERADEKDDWLQRIKQRGR